MTTLNTYKATGIEDWGGVISDEFKDFARLYKNMLNRMCKKNGWKLVNFNRGHYYCSWFIENSGKFIYMSFSDVRHFAREWYKIILYRTAQHERDYTGGSNWYTDLENMERDLQRMFMRMNQGANL